MASNASVYTLANFRNNPNGLLRSNTYKVEGKNECRFDEIINSIGKARVNDQIISKATYLLQNAK